MVKYSDTAMNRNLDRTFAARGLAPEVVEELRETGLVLHPVVRVPALPPLVALALDLEGWAMLFGRVAHVAMMRRWKPNRCLADDPSIQHANWAAEWLRTQKHI